MLAGGWLDPHDLAELGPQAHEGLFERASQVGGKQSRREELLKIRCLGVEELEEERKPGLLLRNLSPLGEGDLQRER